MMCGFTDLIRDPTTGKLYCRVCRKRMMENFEEKLHLENPKGYADLQRRAPRLPFPTSP